MPALCPAHGRRARRWSEVELKALMQAVEQQKEESLDGGSINWSIVAKMVKYRTGKQCREKYLNHLRPNIKKSAWTPREEYILARRHAVSGNRWAEISSHLPGRVENDIKNLWNATRRAKPESKQHSLLWHYAHGLEALGLRPKEALLQAVHKYLALPNVEHLAIDVDRLKRELDRSDDSGTMPELGAAPYVADEEDDDEAIDLDELSDLSEEEDEDLPLPATMGRPVLRASRADEDEEMEEAGSQQRVLADATNISRSTSSVKADAASLGPVRPIIAGPTMHLPQQHASSAPGMRRCLCGVCIDRAAGRWRSSGVVGALQPPSVAVNRNLIVFYMLFLFFSSSQTARPRRRRPCAPP